MCVLLIGNPDAWFVVVVVASIVMSIVVPWKTSPWRSLSAERLSSIEMTWEAPYSPWREADDLSMEGCHQSGERLSGEQSRGFERGWSKKGSRRGSGRK